jgi:hypothetical protein
VRLPDLLTALTAACWVFSIVEIPPIPISPIIYLPFALVALGDRDMWLAWRRVRRSRALQWVVGLLALEALLVLVSQDLSYVTVAEAGRMVAGMVALAGLAMYAASRPERLGRLTVMLLVACGVSLLWYLAELAVGGPFVAVRASLYADIYASQDEGIVETIRSGLTPFRHQLGYQLAAFLPLLLVPVLRPRARRRELLLATVALTVGLTALVASLQRSALVATMISAGLIAWYGRRLGRMMTLGLITGAICVAIASETIRRSDTVAALAESTLFDKLQSQDSKYDSALRAQLQVRALELLWEHPLGLAAADLDWNRVGFRYVYDRMWAVSSEYEKEFAPHNGYLSDAVNLGAGFFLVTVLAVGSVFLTAYRVLRRASLAPPGEQGLAMGIAATVFGLYSFQAMTHNASIVTLEPVSLVALSLLVACDLGAPAPPAER